MPQRATLADRATCNSLRALAGDPEGHGDDQEPVRIRRASPRIAEDPPLQLHRRPTAEWTSRQLVEGPRRQRRAGVTYLIRDRDGNYGELFQAKVDALGLADLVTPKASPWCNGIAEGLASS